MPDFSKRRISIIYSWENWNALLKIKEKKNDGDQIINKYNYN